jgi:ubiquinone/menaquinone biosynthesis C-methylase UbiE
MITKKPDELREFSNYKHASGQWKTKSIYTRSSIIRAFVNFVSLKREGVDKLAKSIGKEHKNPIILDLGAGNGAYSRWFLGRRSGLCVACDWSHEALRSVKQIKKQQIARVAADIHYLPFKPECFDAAFSIDVLGHVTKTEGVLDELLRVVKKGAKLFLHSECADYRSRWPDRALIKRLKEDHGVIADGHISLLPSADLRALYVRRFYIESFQSPAGILGWLLGYPEKYRPLFNEAVMPGMALLCAIFGSLKKFPLIGWGVRLINALTNRCELLLGLNGGGSCFAVLKKNL